MIGYLTLTAGTAKIFVPRQDTVRAIHVEDRQPLHEGQPLLTIETNEVAADGEDVNAAKLDALARQKEWLTGQMAAEEHRTASERERLSALIRGLEAQVAQLQAQINVQSERARLAEGHRPNYTSVTDAT